MATRPEKVYETEIQTIGKTRLYLNAVSRIHRRRKLSNMGEGHRGYFQYLGARGGDGAVDIANCEACIGVLGIQDICHFTSMLCSISGILLFFLQTIEVQTRNHGVIPFSLATGTVLCKAAIDPRNREFDRSVRLSTVKKTRRLSVLI